MGLRQLVGVVERCGAVVAGLWASTKLPQFDRDESFFSSFSDGSIG